MEQDESCSLFFLPCDVYFASFDGGVKGGYNLLAAKYLKVRSEIHSDSKIQ